MFLQRLQVRHWRALKNLELNLDPGLNVIYGPNESGKSSLRDALRSAFLDPSRPRGKSVPKAASPWMGKATPEVVVEFTHGGEPWRLTKKFFCAGSQLERSGRLVAKDDEVHSLLQQELAHHGLSSLWSLQGRVELAEVEPEMRPHLAASETVTPGVAWLEEQLEAAAGEFFTEAQQRPRKPLTEPRTATLEAERESGELRTRLAEAQRKAQELAVLGHDLERLEQRQRELRTRVETQRPLLSAWETYRKQKAELAQLEQQAKHLRAWLSRWQSLQQQQVALEPRVAEWTARRQALDEQAAQPPSREPVEALRRRLDAVQALKQKTLREEMERLKPPTREQVRQIETLAGRIQALEHSLDQASWRAELQALSEIEPILEGQQLQLSPGETHRWKSAQGFTLELPGVARLKVSGTAARQAEDLDHARQDLAELLASAAVESLEEARFRLERATELKAQLGSGGPAVGEIPEDVELAEEGTLPGRIEQAERDWKAAQERHETRVRELQALMLENPESERKMVRAQLAALAAEHEVNSVEQSLPELEQQVAARRAALAVPEGSEVSSDALQALEEELREVESEMETASARRHQLLGELQGQSDLYSRFARAEEQLARAAASQRRTEVKAMGAQLLLQTFQAVRRELEQDVVRPLRERLSARLQGLTGTRYRGLQMEPDFRVKKLLTAEGHAATLGDLSFGTQEQLAFLSRLCLADLLSEKERSLVVFDDNLVHTDPERLELACRMLEESAAKSQILLLTCHPERFLPLLRSARSQDMANLRSS